MRTGSALLSQPALITSTFNDLLDGPDIIVLATSCVNLWHRMSVNDGSLQRRILQLRRLVAMASSGDALKSFFQNLHLPSLTQMHISATVAQIREVVLHIVETASHLTNLVVLQLMPSDERGYPSICDTWVRKLSNCIKGSMPKLVHLSLPRVNLTAGASKMLGEAMATVSRPSQLDLHFAQLSGRAWQALLDGFCQQLAKRDSTSGEGQPQITIHIADSQTPDRESLSQMAAFLGQKANFMMTITPSVPMSECKRRALETRLWRRREELQGAIELKPWKLFLERCLHFLSGHWVNNLSPDLAQTILEKVHSTDEWLAHPRTLSEVRGKLEEWRIFMEKVDPDCHAFAMRPAPSAEIEELWSTV